MAAQQRTPAYADDSVVEHRIVRVDEDEYGWHGHCVECDVAVHGLGPAAAARRHASELLEKKGAT